MTRLESSAWTLAGGSLCVFALAVVLSHAPWRYTLVVMAAVVAAWSLRGPLLAGVALGGVAWAFLTGFDVNSYGVLTITGLGDAARAGLLIAAASAGTMTGWLWAAGHAYTYSADEDSPAPKQAALDGVYRPSRVSDDRYDRPVEVPQQHPRARDTYGPVRDGRTASVVEDPAEEARHV
ncbi:MAG: hypothetical protein JWN52_949 [Actinomycetia bacterium]|nr:hypothetical protein [Actinomycetes bacterium]